MNFFKTKNKGDLAPYLDRSPFRLEVKNGETVATKKVTSARHSRLPR